MCSSDLEVVAVAEPGFSRLVTGFVTSPSPHITKFKVQQNALNQTLSSVLGSEKLFSEPN